MMGVISEALIRRSPDRISDPAPGRTPIAVARPPLVLPGFSSPRSIILTSSMTAFFRISESIAIAIIRIRLDFGFGISEVNGMASVTVARQRREASTKEKRMQSTNWAGAHSGALREYLAKGMSFSEI